MSNSIEPDNCTLVCSSNATLFGGTLGDNDGNATEVVRLTFLSTSWSRWSDPIAERFAAKKNGAVKINFIRKPNIEQVNADVINEAKSKTKLIDGFLTGPSVSGNIVEYDGWADLTSFVQESAENSADWSDILLGYRKYVAQYQGKIIMYPLDGDILSMFYRRDILDHFGLKVPRTWDEYNAVAKATHGQTFENQTLIGSCVGRVLGCGGQYWANMLIATLTQTQGPWSGHLFDTKNLDPLTDGVLEKVLEWLEEQVKYGPPDEFENCIRLNFDYMHGGQCVLTYNWGNSFKRYLEKGTQLRDRFGVAPTPGSAYVYDRETKELVDCDANICRHGTNHEDIGYVNRAPYLAYGGWACAVNNFIDPVKKRLATEFCAFASSEEETTRNVIPNAMGNETENGQDPFRSSHLAVQSYVDQGYERTSTEQYINAIQTGLTSDNLVVDARFPKSIELNSVLDKAFHDYLNATKHGLIPDNDRESRRIQISRSITLQWRKIINEYDSQGTTRVSILDSYQKLRGVYVKENNMNQIRTIRGYGYALTALILLSTIIFAIWTIKLRSEHVVRASQPFFLVMICFGTAILGLTIIPLGIDDSIASASGAGMACMSVPWLLTLGWSILFSALYAKLRRINLVHENARRFRRLKVKEKDVMLPFAVLFTINVCFLLVWTIWDPLVFTRVQTSETDSYGTCSVVDSDSAIWKISFSFVAITNGAALILANMEAYRARDISTEYGESKYIAMSMGSILQLIIVGLPSLFLVGDNPAASYFIRVSMVFVVCASVLYLMFIPKMYLWWKDEDRQSGESPMLHRRKSGLKFSKQVNGLETSARIKEYQAKIRLLEQLFQEKGVVTDEVFMAAGLGTDREQHMISSSQKESGCSASQKESGYSGAEADSPITTSVMRSTHSSNVRAVEAPMAMKSMQQVVDEIEDPSEEESLSVDFSKDITIPSKVTGDIVNEDISSSHPAEETLTMEDIQGGPSEGGDDDVDEKECADLEARLKARFSTSFDKVDTDVYSSSFDKDVNEVFS